VPLHFFQFPLPIQNLKSKISSFLGGLGVLAVQPHAPAQRPALFCAACARA
jgi:hypothetical protein